MNQMEERKHSKSNKVRIITTARVQRFPGCLTMRIGSSPCVLASACCAPPVAMLLLSIVAVFVSRRYPPYAVIPREAAATRPDVRQGDVAREAVGGF